MKKIKSLSWLFVAILGLGLLSSCKDDNEPQKEEPTPQGDPKITLNMSEVNVTLEGGRFTVEYAVENPVSGQSVQITPKADWINDLDLSLTGIVTFSVAKNRTVEPRESSIEFSYEGAETVALVVKQEQGNEPDFTNDNVRATPINYTMDIYAKDKQRPFIMLSASQDYIDGLVDSEGNYGTDLAIFEDDMMYYEWLGGMFYGKTLSGMLAEVARYGDQLDRVVNNAQPIMDYVLYTYHINIDECTMDGDLYRFGVTTPNVDQVDVEFDFELDIDEAEVFSTVTAKNGYTGRFYFDVLPRVVVEDEKKEGQSVEDYLIEWWNTIVNNNVSGGASYADVLSNCSSQSDNYTFDLLQETEYYLFSMAVDPEYAFAASTPQVQLFETGTVSMSDLEIDIIVSNIGSQGADIKLVTSNYDPYFAGYVKKEIWDTYGSNDQERFASLMSENVFEKLIGDVEVSVLGLSPETDYVVYAFGSAGGVMTTDQIFTEEFTTSFQGAGQATMTFDSPGYFGIAEVCEQDSGWNSYLDSDGLYCIFPFRFILDPADTETYYWDVFDNTNYTYSDEELVNSMLYSTPKEFLASVYLVEYNAPITFAGFAADESGYGPLCRYDVTPTQDGIGDVDDFFAFLQTMYEAPVPQQARLSERPLDGAAIVVEQQVQEPEVAEVKEFKSRAAVLFQGAEKKSTSQKMMIAD